MKELETILSGMVQEPGRSTADIVGIATELSVKADMFLKERGVSTGVVASHGVQKLSTGFGLEGLTEIGTTSIEQFVEEAGVPARHQQSAVEEMKIILGRAAMANGQSASILTQHFATVDKTVSAQCVGFEALLPDSLSTAYGDSTVAGMEHFGVDTDKLEADLVAAITVSMMKWHNSISTRMLPTIASVNPLIVYRRDEYLVYDLADDVSEMTPVLDLYRDPSHVKNTLQPIIPQSTSAVIDNQGFIPVGMDIDLFEVGKDSGKYGHGDVNRTDLIADGIALESILISVVNANSGAPITEVFEIAIPSSRGRLHRMPDHVSTVRSASIVYTATLRDTTVSVSGTAPTSGSAIAALFGSDPADPGTASADAVKLDIRFTPTVDIRTGNANVYGTLVGSGIHAGGVAYSDVDNATLMADLEITVLGVKLDAKYSEENFRKSSIIATQESRELMYQIPPGRFYGADRSHLQDASGEDRNRQIANLQRIAAIGQDSTLLTALIGFLDTVNMETAAYALDPINNARPGLNYAAGGKVNPTSIVADLDFTGIDSFDDSRRQAAIGGRVETVLSGVVCDLMEASKMRQQMGSTKLVFRALCSGEVLGKVIGMGTDSVEATDGVEYALQLPGNVVVEFITTTFSEIGDTIIMVPFIKDAPSSDLNFAHNRSCGTVVCAFTATHVATASAERLMAAVREAPVPTNIVGAIINVKGLEQATFAAVPTP